MRMRSLVQKNSAEICLALLLVVFIPLQSFFSKPSTPDKLSYIPPSLEIKYLSMGFKEQVSDAFWLRVVQDTHYCESHKENGYCVGKSWFYQVVNLVTELSDDFAEAYYYGGLALSIMIQDSEGASAIFDKAVKKYPNEWPMLYLAAYHALFEEKNKSKAAKLYLRAADHGAPDWVRLSAGKLAADGGDEQISLLVLEQLIAQQKDPEWIAQLQKKLEEKKRDLKKSK